MDRVFLVNLDALDDATATFGWQDGETADRVRVQIPRHEWKQAGRLGVITVTLADRRTPECHSRAEESA